MKKEENEFAYCKLPSNFSKKLFLNRFQNKKLFSKVRNKEETRETKEKRKRNERERERNERETREKRERNERNEKR